MVVLQNANTITSLSTLFLTTAWPTSVPTFEYYVAGAVLVMLPGNQIAVCGGYYIDNDIEFCAYYKANQGYWMRGPTFGSLPSFGMAINETTLLLAELRYGGRSVIVTMDKPRKTGPTWPTAACATQINSTTAIFIGLNRGKTNRYLSIQDLSLSQDGPSTVFDRHDAMCGVVQDMSDPSASYAILTGGQVKNPVTGIWDYTRSTEILIIGSDQWIEGPDLPAVTFRGQLVTAPDGKSIVLSGGSSWDENGVRTFEKSLIRFQCANGVDSCRWTKLEIEMDHGRSDHVAAFLPENDFACFKWD